LTEFKKSYNVFLQLNLKGQLAMKNENALLRLFELLDLADDEKPLPEGYTVEKVFEGIRHHVDALAKESDRLKYIALETSERAKSFAETKKYASNDVSRFKSRMVVAFRDQEDKKFPGQNFTANIVKKTTIVPNRPPEFSDYTSKDRMKFVVTSFQWNKEPNADAFAALKAAGLPEFCGYKFSWDQAVMKSVPEEEISSFVDFKDSSFVQFKPKKG